MAGQNYYLITSLPPLGELGTAPPLGLADLLAHVRDSAGPGTLVQIVLLGDDLLQRQAYLAGEIKEVAPAVLTAGQVRNEEPLPDDLAGPEQPLSPLADTDAVWANYFRRAAEMAARRRSDFLAAWTGYEVAMRNALAAERAKALGLEAEQYMVAADLGRPDANFEALLSEWAAADPLAGLRVLDRARWAWIDEHDAWFSFADDEVAAYAARLALLHRWHRLSQAVQARQGGQAGAEAC